MALYDKHYQSRDYFGNPYPEFVQYVSSFDKHLSVIDLGCGQGRDSMALGRLGFHVIGVDISEVGIKQLNETAKIEKLHVKGLVADFKDITNLYEFDIIILDSIFHFYKKDIDDETKLLKHILSQMKNDAIVIIMMQYAKNRVTIMKNVIDSIDDHFNYLYETTFLYEAFYSEFYRVSIEKQ